MSTNWTFQTKSESETLAALFSSLTNVACVRHDSELCEKDKPQPSAMGKSTFHIPSGEANMETQQFGVSLTWPVQLVTCVNQPTNMYYVYYM